MVPPPAFCLDKKTRDDGSKTSAKCQPNGLNRCLRGTLMEEKDVTRCVDAEWLARVAFEGSANDILLCKAKSEAVPRVTLTCPGTHKPRRQ